MLRCGTGDMDSACTAVPRERICGATWALITEASTNRWAPQYYNGGVRERHAARGSWPGPGPGLTRFKSSENPDLTLLLLLAMSLSSLSPGSSYPHAENQ